MKKIYMIVAVVVALLVGTLIFFKFKDHSLDKTIEKVKAYDRYELTCQMEMAQNDELKNYEVKVDYLKKEKDEYYKVELYDKSLNQAQIIIRNQEGVFVLTPTMNQIFKFQSDWPTNSPKPYIYRSLISLLEKNKVEKIKDGYKVQAKVKYPNDQRIVSQEMTFDKALNPKRVVCLDKDETEIITTKISTFDPHIKLKLSQFNQNRVLKKAKKETRVSYDSSILYPVAMLGSDLDSETVSVIDGKKNHVLKFKGEKSYTVVESYGRKDDVQVNVIQDEVIDMVDGFAYYSNNKLTMINSGLICSIYSQDLTKDEMVSVMTSMQSCATK